MSGVFNISAKTVFDLEKNPKPHRFLPVYPARRKMMITGSRAALKKLFILLQHIMHQHRYRFFKQAHGKKDKETRCVWLLFRSMPIKI